MAFRVEFQTQLGLAFVCIQHNNIHTNHHKYTTGLEFFIWIWFVFNIFKKQNNNQYFNCMYLQMAMFLYQICLASYLYANFQIPDPYIFRAHIPDPYIVDPLLPNPIPVHPASLNWIDNHVKEYYVYSFNYFNCKLIRGSIICLILAYKHILKFALISSQIYS